MISKLNFSSVRSLYNASSERYDAIFFCSINVSHSQHKVTFFHDFTSSLFEFKPLWLINQYGLSMPVNGQCLKNWLHYTMNVRLTMNYGMLYIDKLREFLMSKIKQTDISKLSQLEQQIEQLKEQKKQQEAQLSNKIGGYF